MQICLCFSVLVPVSELTVGSDSVDPSHLCWGCVNNGRPREDKESRQKSGRCNNWECSRYIWRRFALQRCCPLAQEAKYGWSSVKKHKVLISITSSFCSNNSVRLSPTDPLSHLLFQTILRPLFYTTLETVFSDVIQI
jgi:hypothetical protein